MVVGVEHPYLMAFLRLALACIAGALVGLERTHHGRPAGFRTHALVCSASAVLMLLTQFPWPTTAIPSQALRIDPTRMAQGIMTGIGFLGAGVIMKDKLKIRGLTTSASIWATAAIGIVIGIGYYFAAGLSLVLTLATLSLLRRLENSAPTVHFAQLTVSFPRQDRMDLGQLQALLHRHHIDGINVAYQLRETGGRFQYRFTLKTAEKVNFDKLAETLLETEGIHAFSLSPAAV